MLDFLIKLLGIEVGRTQRIVDKSLSFYPPGWGWVLIGLLVFLGVSALVWVTYAFVCFRQASRASWKTIMRWLVLSWLRTLFLLLILLPLIRPVLSLTVESSTQRSLILMFDTTKSMGIEDRRSDDKDLKRVAMAKDQINPAKGFEQPLDSGPAGLDKVARMEVVKAVLKNKRLDLVPELAKEYDIVGYTFDRNLTQLSLNLPRHDQRDPTKTGGGSTFAVAARNIDWAKMLDAKGPVTAIGDNLQEVVNKQRGQSIAGIVLVTDGANNVGSRPLDAALMAKRDGMPLFIYGVGIGSPRDIIVGEILAPEVAFQKDEVPVQVSVRSQNLAGQSAKLTLKLIDKAGGEKLVDEKEVKFGDDAEQIVGLKFSPDTSGQFQLKAEIAARDDETSKDNNATARPLRIVEEKIKVLLVERQPRWEYQYLMAMLERDRRVDLKVVLYEANKAVTRGEKTPYLEEFPTKDEDLIKYDVLILGDVDPKVFSGQQLDAIHRFVSEAGGSIVFIAGRSYNPSSYYKTPLGKLLPVDPMETATSDLPGGGPVADRPVKLRLTPAGQRNIMLRLVDKDAESLKLWTDLPPVYWTNRVLREKPGAEVLLTDPDDTKKYQGKEMPVMAFRQYGVGQALYMGTDNTWRWRKNAGDKHYTTLWGQVVYRMALLHLLGGSKTTQLYASQEKYTAGERVSVTARLYTKTFQPLTEKTVKGSYRLTTGGGPADKHEVTLTQVPDKPGIYAADFLTPAIGVYQFTINDREKEASLDFHVVEPTGEYGDTAMDEHALREMATASGGAFFREEDLHKLPEAIGKGTDVVIHKHEVELLRWPFVFLYFLLMMLVLSGEWMIRKFAGLK